MSKSKSVISKTTFKILSIALMSTFALASCGGGGGEAQQNPVVSGPPAYQAGFTQTIPDASSRVIYVSSSTGNDANDGLNEATPVKTIPHGYSLTRAGYYDFLKLKRGDVWRDTSPTIRDASLGTVHGGKDAKHPFVITYYGTAIARPRVELAENFINLGGQTVNNFAMIGLELFVYTNDPADPYFTGTVEGGIRWVANGDSILFEDNKFIYSRFKLESYQYPAQLTNVAVRYNSVTYSYSNLTNCTFDNSNLRPIAMFVDHVNGLLIEGNVFDHNGWNEAVPGACATMFGQSIYLSSISNLLLRNNIISRSASIGLKFISTTALTSVNNTIEDNFIYDNEIGMSISGHVAGDYRYVNMNVTKNVVSQTGLGAHTGRSLGWAIDTQDYDTADISENFILLQTVPTNSQGLATTASPSYRNVSIHDNMFYAVNGNSITNTPYAAWTGNTIANNFILAVPGGSCAIQNTGAFTGIAFRNNRYSGTNAFCLNTTHTTLSAWNTASGETGSSMFTGTLVDPTRTVATYATSLGYASVDAFFQAATSMNQLNWDDKLTAPAINAYIKAGFKLN